MNIQKIGVTNHVNHQRILFGKKNITQPTQIQEEKPAKKHTTRKLIITAIALTGVALGAIYGKKFIPTKKIVKDLAGKFDNASEKLNSTSKNGVDFEIKTNTTGGKIISLLNKDKTPKGNAYYRIDGTLDHFTELVNGKKSRVFHFDEKGETPKLITEYDKSGKKVINRTTL